MNDQKYRYTEGYISMFPKTKTIRKIALFETNDKFILVAGDKTKRERHVIIIKKLDDTVEHTLEHIIEEEFVSEDKQTLETHIDAIRNQSQFLRKKIKDAHGIGKPKFLLIQILIASNLILL